MYAHKIFNERLKKYEYRHFATSPSIAASHTQKKIPVYKILIKENKKADKSVDYQYWAWWENESQKFIWCYGHRGQLVMTFANIYVAEELGKGKAMPVIVKELEKIRYKDIKINKMKIKK